MKRAGTTLIELMFALTIFAIFGVSMTMLLVRGARNDEGVDARRDARGVARSALNIVESELRMAEPAGIIAQTDDSTFTFREPIAFGLVCGVAGGVVTMSMLPSSDVPSSLSIAGFSGWAYRDSTGGYQYQPTTSLSTGTSATCAAAGITTLTAASGRVVQSQSVVSVAAGQAAFLYRQIQYSIRASTTLPGRRALFRTAGANGNPTEVATPFTSGARFRWYILDGVTPQDTLPTDFADLRGVQFVLTAQSRNTPRNSSAPVQAPFTTSVFFQNRPN